jgi:hypothetical protein
MSLEPITGDALEVENGRLRALLEGKSEYVDCICPGCPRKIPEAWASGMCQPCCEEDCEHTDGARAALAAVTEERDELLAMLKVFHSSCGGRPRAAAVRCDACALIARIEGTPTP